MNKKRRKDLSNAIKGIIWVLCECLQFSGLIRCAVVGDAALYILSVIAWAISFMFFMANERCKLAKATYIFFKYMFLVGLTLFMIYIKK